MIKNIKSQCPISIRDICSQIISNKATIGITTEQIKSLISSTTIFPYPEIISAIKETLYYRTMGEITPTSLDAIPESERKPIHHLFAAFYNPSFNPKN